MQYGFVIDHTKCIGCHACTVACKSENEVPLGSFRTWVKYTERGEFPEVKRSFAVLRCNQCTHAPCVTICPVNALEKRNDGIVDVDPARCIGCKACMQGCPYDALYLNPDSGTAEKCHFCAHRVEVGLAPACAVVCPTEAIVPGDFHDPGSRVSRLRSTADLSGRKTEAGTGPNVLYREVDPAGIDPLAASPHGGYLWANRAPGSHEDAERFQSLQEDAEARARTTYDVDHPAYWGTRITAYLFLKSAAAGLFLVAALGALSGTLPPTRGAGIVGASLFFLALTLLLLVVDLKKPRRFLYILIHPNWSSWLARGSFFLAAFGGVASMILVLHLGGSGSGPAVNLLLGGGSVLAVLSAAYTGWLFGQARGRVLWMRRGLWAHLVVQALVAGSALTLVVAGFAYPGDPFTDNLGVLLLVSLLLHGIFLLTEERLHPRGRKREFRAAARLVSRGPFAPRHYMLGIALGIAVPAVVIYFTNSCHYWSAASILALIGLWAEEDITVKAGQSLSIS